MARGKARNALLAVAGTLLVSAGAAADLPGGDNELLMGLDSDLQQIQADGRYEMLQGYGSPEAVEETKRRIDAVDRVVRGHVKEECRALGIPKRVCDDVVDNTTVEMDKRIVEHGGWWATVVPDPVTNAYNGAIQADADTGRGFRDAEIGAVLAHEYGHLVMGHVGGDHDGYIRAGRETSMALAGWHGAEAQEKTWDEDPRSPEILAHKARSASRWAWLERGTGERIVGAHGDAHTREIAADRFAVKVMHRVTGGSGSVKSFISRMAGRWWGKTHDAVMKVGGGEVKAEQAANREMYVDHSTHPSFMHRMGTIGDAGTQLDAAAGVGPGKGMGAKWKEWAPPAAGAGAEAQRGAKGKAGKGIGE